MSSEQREELAALLALDCLEGDEREQAVRLRAEDPDFNRLVEELEQASTLLVATAEPISPSAELKQQLMQQIHAESRQSDAQSSQDSHSDSDKVIAIGPPPAAVRQSPQPMEPEAPVPQGAWLGWAAALGMAIATGWMLVDRVGLRDDNDKLAQREIAAREALQDAEQQLTAIPELQQELASAGNELLSLRETRETMIAEMAERDNALAEMSEQLAQSTSELEQLRQRDQLAQTRIASLQATVEAYQTAQVIVLWDEEEKRGVVQIEGLPPLEEEQDYQFWVVDPNQEQPVDAGVVELDETGSARVNFEPRRPIDTAAVFAISIENAGGVPFNEGPIILASE